VRAAERAPRVALWHFPHGQVLWPGSRLAQPPRVVAPGRYLQLLTFEASGVQVGLGGRRVGADVCAAADTRPGTPSLGLHGRRQMSLKPLRSDTRFACLKMQVLPLGQGYNGSLAPGFAVVDGVGPQGAGSLTSLLPITDAMVLPAGV
jgi:hypothetical protein